MRQTGDNGQGMPAGLRDCQPVRECKLCRNADRRISCQSSGETSGICRLYTDNLQTRFQRLQYGGHPCQQATTSDRHDNRLGFRHLLQNLEGQRALRIRDVTAESPFCYE